MLGTAARFTERRSMQIKSCISSNSCLVRNFKLRTFATSTSSDNAPTSSLISSSFFSAFHDENFKPLQKQHRDLHRKQNAASRKKVREIKQGQEAAFQEDMKSWNKLDGFTEESHSKFLEEGPDDPELEFLSEDDDEHTVEAALEKAAHYELYAGIRGSRVNEKTGELIEDEADEDDLPSDDERTREAFFGKKNDKGAYVNRAFTKEEVEEWDEEIGMPRKLTQEAFEEYGKFSWRDFVNMDLEDYHQQMKFNADDIYSSIRTELTEFGLPLKTNEELNEANVARLANSAFRVYHPTSEKKGNKGKKFVEPKNWYENNRLQKFIDMKEESKRAREERTKVQARPKPLQLSPENPLMFRSIVDPSVHDKFSKYRFRKVTLKVKVDALRLPKAVEERLIALVDRRYNPLEKTLTLNVDKFPTRDDNTVHVKKLMQELLAEAWKAHPDYVAPEAVKEVLGVDPGVYLFFKRRMITRTEAPQ